MLGLRNRLRSLLGRVRRGLAVDVAMDLGTANTLIYVRGEGIVVNEPSLVAVDVGNGRVVGLGREAGRYAGRTPDRVRVVRPLKDGVIADIDTSMAMIRGFLAKVFGFSPWVKPRIVIAVPSGITQVEQRAVRDSAYLAGARHVFLLEEPLASAMGADLDVETPAGNMVVDIGGGTTEVAIISLCATAHYESVRTAGDAMDEAIVRYVHRHMQLQISPRIAEGMKVRLGCATPPELERQTAFTGKELSQSGMRTVVFTSSQMSEALEGPVNTIIDTVQRSLENAPPVLLPDIREHGMVLTGGGSLLTGLDALIGKMTGIKTVRADDPLTSVVRGCAMAVEEPERWQRVFMP